MLEKLKQHEAALAALEIQIKAAEAQSAPILELTLEQITHLCDQTAVRLRTGDIPTVRRILQNFINKIAVDRDELAIHGVVEFFLPVPQGEKNEFVSLSGAPGGAVFYRHNFNLDKHPLN